jgi:hypothetical protein
MGRIVHCPMSMVRNIRDFLFGDISVGDTLPRHRFEEGKKQAKEWNLNKEIKGGKVGG